MIFNDNGSGGDAHFITTAGGSVDFGNSTGANTAGSIAGAGDYVIDDTELTVGSNNLSTILSGTIGGTNGSLVKVGVGTLTISGAASPSDSVAIDGGGLQVDGTLNTSGAVTVNDGGSQRAPGYGLLNLESGRRWRHGAGAWSAFARIDNVFDRRYIGSVIVNEGNARYYEPGPDRMLSVGARWDWSAGD